MATLEENCKNLLVFFTSIPSQIEAALKASAQEALGGKPESVDGLVQNVKQGLTSYIQEDLWTSVRTAMLSKAGVVASSTLSNALKGGLNLNAIKTSLTTALTEVMQATLDKVKEDVIAKINAIAAPMLPEGVVLLDAASTDPATTQVQNALTAAGTTFINNAVDMLTDGLVDVDALTTFLLR